MESKNKTGFFTALINELKNLLKNPKKLIPTFVLCAVWLVFSLMSGFGANIPVLRFFYTLTYANGGMFGGFFGTVGGIFGKAVFAAVVNTIVLSICEKKNPFSGLGKGLKGTFAGGLYAVAPLFIGGGLGVLLYWFFNITSSPVNCAVAVVAAVGALSAIGKKNGLLFSLIFGAMSKLSGGKTPSVTTVNRVIMGFSLGFALSFPITFARYPLVLFLVGLVLLIAGIVLAFVGKNGTKKIAATAALVLMIGALLLPVFPVSVFAAGLPKGFTAPEEIEGFSLVNQVGALGKYSGFYLEPEHITSGFKNEILNFDYYYSGISPADPVVISADPLTLNRDGSNGSYHFTGSYSCTQNGHKGDMIDYSKYTYSIEYSVEGTLSNIRFDNNRIIADFSATETVTYSTDQPDAESGTKTNKISGTSVRDDCDWQTKEGAHYLVLYSPNHMTNAANSSLGIRFRLAGLLEGNSSGANVVPSGSDEGILDSDYVPYRGRLTYTNGATNKHGQPFPDLMDFDMDGDIDYADRVLQHELVHNPDYLDQPGSPAAIAAIAILTMLLGGGGAIAGTAAVSVAGSAAAEVLGGTVAEAAGETIGNAVSGIDDLGSHISRDSDGDLNVTDPATGEKRLYKNNGDGTYTNPLTGATYTESELKSSLESRADNAGTIRQDAAAAQEAIAAQREDNEGLSDYAKEYAVEKAKQAAHDEYVEKLGEKYGVHSGDEDDIRAKIGYEQGKAEIEFYENTELESEYKNKQEYVETVEKAADTSIDVLADVTGRKDIKAAYTMAKNTVARTTEAYVNDKNVMVGMAQGAIEGTIDVIKDNVDGAGNKLVANVVGETYKDAMNATINGKDMTEAVVGGIGKGLVNTGVDVGMDLVGDGVKGMMGDAAEDAIKNAVTKGAEVTKGSLADGAKTLAGDLVKDGLDEAFKAPGEE